jgi:hypothetical protein
MRTLAGGRTSYPRVRWIDGQLPEGSLTLVVGISQTYYFDHRVRGGGDFDGARMARYLSVPDAEALRARLRNEGFTHLAVFRPTLVTPERASTGLRAELETVLTPEAMNAFQSFLAKHAVLLASEASCELYALR